MLPIPTTASYIYYLKLVVYSLTRMLRTTTLRTTLPFALTANVPPVQRFISTTSVLLNEQTLQEDIRSRLKAALKTAMKAKEKDTAGTIRVSEAF